MPFPSLLRLCFKIAFMYIHPPNYIKCLIFSYDPEIPCMKDVYNLFSSQQQVLPSFIFWNVYSDFSYCNNKKWPYKTVFRLVTRKRSFVLSGTSFYFATQFAIYLSRQYFTNIYFFYIKTISIGTYGIIVL